MNKVILVASACVLGLGCGIAKKHPAATVRADSTAPAVVSDTALAKRLDTVVLDPSPVPDPALVERLLARPAYRTFSAKAKAAYEADGDRKEFSFVVRIDAGKAIWVSVSALGGLVNVARALITPDSVQAVNYLQREAYQLPYSAAGRLLPVSVPFETLQALLTGDPLFATGDGVVATDSPADVTLSWQRTNTTQTETFRKDDNTLRAASFASIGSVNRLSLQLGYDDYSTRSSRPFPKDRTAQIVTQGKQSTLQLHFDDPIWDGPVEMPFSIPSKYTLK